MSVLHPLHQIPANFRARDPGHVTHLSQGDTVRQTAFHTRSLFIIIFVRVTELNYKLCNPEENHTVAENTRK